MPRKGNIKSKASKYENENSEADDPGPSSKKQKLSNKSAKESKHTKIKKNIEVIQKEIKRDALTDLNGNSIIKYYENLQKGNSVQKYRYSVKRTLIDQIKSFQMYKAESPFDRRVTFIEWHPNNDKLLAVASKGGDINVWNYEQPINEASVIKGIGPGGSVQAMKFDVTSSNKLYTVSIEGKLLVINFETNQRDKFLDTKDFKKWYVSLDINWGSRTLVVGDNSGHLTMLTTEGEIVHNIKIHKKVSRVTHVEFSKREPWLLCSTSNDRTIKLWDIRQFKEDLSEVAEPLHCITHEKPLNSAYFSLTDGCRLLTTDQYDKLHVYRSPLWNLDTEITHPHRQFQHLTPIRAYWHPLEDIVLVGRYPHKDASDSPTNELRTIDFFDADTGELLHQHSGSGFNGIMSLNRFNCSGDALASGSGTKIMIWKPKYKTNASIDLKPFKPLDNCTKKKKLTRCQRNWTRFRPSQELSHSKKKTHTITTDSKRKMPKVAPVPAAECGKRMAEAEKPKARAEQKMCEKPVFRTGVQRKATGSPILVMDSAYARKNFLRPSQIEKVNKTTKLYFKAEFNQQKTNSIQNRKQVKALLPKVPENELKQNKTDGKSIVKSESATVMKVNPQVVKNMKNIKQS